MASIEKRLNRPKPYRVRWRDAATRKMRSKSFVTLKKAQHFLAETYHISSEDEVDPNLTLNEILDRWIGDAVSIGLNGREPIERSTERNYRYHSEVIMRLTGQVGASDLDKQICEKLRDQLLGIHSRKNAKKILTSFKSALNHAFNVGLLPSNPASGVHVHISKRSQMAERTEIPSISEITRILQAIDELMKADDSRTRSAWRRYGPLFYLMLFSGMRPTELRGLSWKGIDWKRGGVNVTQGADEFGKIGMPKSGAAYRFIPVPKMVLDHLREWSEHCPQGRQNLVFPTGNGNVENHGNITRRGWYVLCKQAGLIDEVGKARYNLYALRHTKASLEIERGMSAKKLQRIMGHEAISMTFDIYGHLFEDDWTGDEAEGLVDMLKCPPSVPQDASSH